MTETILSISIVERNELSLKRLKARELYLTIMKNVESILDEYRFNLSKTKTTIGHNFTSSTMVDMRECDPTVILEVNVDKLEDGCEKQVFSLKKCATEASNEEMSEVRRRAKSNSIDNKEQSKNRDQVEKSLTVFRPFGILEPITARHARQNIEAVLPLLCDLANLQYDCR